MCELALQGGCSYLHFAGEQIEIQRLPACPRSPNKYVTRQDLNPGLSYFEISCYHILLSPDEIATWHNSRGRHSHYHRCEWQLGVVPCSGHVSRDQRGGSLNGRLQGRNDAGLTWWDWKGRDRFRGHLGDRLERIDQLKEAGVEAAFEVSSLSGPGDSHALGGLEIGKRNKGEGAAGRREYNAFPPLPHFTWTQA